MNISHIADEFVDKQVISALEKVKDEIKLEINKYYDPFKGVYILSETDKESLFKVIDDNYISRIKEDKK